MNSLLPVFLNLRRRPVLVVGGGTAALQKIKVLLDAGADVTVIAPDLSANVESLAAAGKVVVRRRGFRDGDAERFSAVIGATDDPAVQRRIVDDATGKNIPVNIVDTPELCTFYFSSVFKKGDLTVAVSTNGKSPTLGKIIRDAIAEEYSEGYPEILESVGDLRSDVIRTIPGAESRKKLFEQMVRSELERRSLHPGVNHVRDGAAEKGSVYLVGAGPGDPELITVKGLRILRGADVVLHDALVSGELLAHVPASAETVDVGKRGGVPSARQQEINERMIREARAGKCVVRLKAGDPFVFGRGGEELEALREAGIEPEIVPGITAGAGVPSALGIPLTHRSMSSSVVFVTGHEDPAKPGERIDWERIASVDTIVVYMGVRNLGTIVSRLVRHGVPPAKPAAVVFDGTLPGQSVITGTLADIVKRSGDRTPGGPGLVIVGDVVGLLSLPHICAPPLSESFA